MSKAELNINGGTLKTGLLKPVIRVDVVSDVVCPWCYIGKRRLEKAIAEVSDKYTVEVFYHPFELNPATPQSGVNQREHLAEKFGGDERYQSITNHTSSVARQEGLDMNFEKQSVLPNTRKAHALIFAAGNTDKQLAVTEAFFKAYFTDGIDLSKDENLINIAVKVGLDRPVAETAISSHELLDSIASQEHDMQKLGISGVPFYILNNEYGVSGAQASETFIKVFEELNKASTQNGDACSVDGTC
ncbi:DsbA family oxidoreductase [Chryseolinea sp. T2]|uniref:DsbA family oxidoreductase n=1 Tax=Chryseolinea sp. T2 TaxID=3129255 RepID=UPI00307787BE